MKTILSPLILVLLLVASPARADSGSGSGSAVLVDTGSGSGSAVAPSPSSQLHDPTTNPAGALDDAKAAKKSGWPLLVLVVLIAITKTASYAGGKLAFLGKWLSAGKHAMIVAGVGTVLAACYNVLATGGSWYAVLMAAGAAGFALISSHAPATAVEKHADSST